MNYDYYDMPMVEASFTYKDESGTVTTLEKKVHIDYLGEETELAVLNRLYQEFLTACTFAVTADDTVVVIAPDEKVVKE